MDSINKRKNDKDPLKDTRTKLHRPVPVRGSVPLPPRQEIHRPVPTRPVPTRPVPPPPRQEIHRPVPTRPVPPPPTRPVPTRPVPTRPMPPPPTRPMPPPPTRSMPPPPTRPMPPPPQQPSRQETSRSMQTTDKETWKKYVTQKAMLDFKYAMRNNLRPEGTNKAIYIENLDHNAEMLWKWKLFHNLPYQSLADRSDEYKQVYNWFINLRLDKQKNSLHLLTHYLLENEPEFTWNWGNTQNKSITIPKRIRTKSDDKKQKEEDLKRRKQQFIAKYDKQFVSVGHKDEKGILRYECVHCNAIMSSSAKAKHGKQACFRRKYGEFVCMYCEKSFVNADRDHKLKLNDRRNHEVRCTDLISKYGNRS